MAKSVFYSFHYARDAWRVQQVINIGSIENQTILNAQDWEEVKGRGDPAIEAWINDQMANKSAVVVLVGAETESRPWVVYEIAKAWDEKRPVVGIRIHGLADSSGNTDTPGKNPFGSVSLQGGGTVADYVQLHDPTGATSQDVHATIAAGLESWVDGAYRRG